MNVGSEPPIVVKIGHGRTVRHTRDENPVKVLVSENDGPVCSICEKHRSRYTCPKCQSPYCSVDCYKNHNMAGDESKPCSEVFYKDKVSEYVKLEAMDRKGDAEALLKRFQHQDDFEDLSHDELVELSLALDRTDLDEGDLPQDLLQAFERDLTLGHFQKSVIEDWRPWWEHDFGSSSPTGQGTILGTGSEVPRPSLDEQLLRVPNFSSLVGKRPSPKLLFSAIDIMYSYCWTMRLYHGLTNILSFSEVEAANTLVDQSKVLAHEATHYSSLADVLTNCSTRAMPAVAVGGGLDSTRSTILSIDLPELLLNQRFVGRALLESSEIISTACRTLRKDGKADKATIARLRRVRKKVDFFLSWSQQCRSFNDELCQEIRSWTSSWGVGAKEMKMQLPK